MNLKAEAARRAHPQAAAIVARFDQLLDALEALALKGQSELPPPLVEALETEGVEPFASPRRSADWSALSVTDAHDAVLTAQTSALHEIGSWLN